MRVLSPLIIGLLSLAYADLVLAAAKVYKWTDEKGITHFSEHPPLNTKTTVVKPQIALGESESSSSAASSVASHQTSSQSLEALRAAAKIDPQRCADAKTNVESLKTYTHIKIKEGDGYRFLTPDEQQQKLNEANQAIAESCAP